jgi:hypothetical protein
MTSDNETTVGLTKETHAVLQQLKNEGVFKEMVDGYRLGISLAIAMGNIASEDIKTTTIWNVGSLDPDDRIRNVIVELFPEATGRPYAFAERLAEWGVAELGQLYENNNLKFGNLIETIIKPQDGYSG